jgi:hypothetical protein
VLLDPQVSLFPQLGQVGSGARSLSTRFSPQLKRKHSLQFGRERRIPYEGSKVLVFGDLYRGGQFIRSRQGDMLQLSDRRMWVRLPFSMMPCVAIEAGVCPIPEKQGLVCERVHNCSILDDYMLHVSYADEEFTRMVQLKRVRRVCKDVMGVVRDVRLLWCLMCTRAIGKGDASRIRNPLLVQIKRGKDNPCVTHLTELKDKMRIKGLWNIFLARAKAFMSIFF